MASDSVEYFGLNLWDPTQPDVALGSPGNNQGATTYGTRPFQGTKTAGRQPSTGTTYDPQQIYNRGTNFTSQSSGQETPGEGAHYSAGFGNDQGRRDCLARGGDWDDVRGRCITHDDASTPINREGLYAACMEKINREPDKYRWDATLGKCVASTANNDVCPDPSQREDPDNPGTCIPIEEDCGLTASDCIGTAILNEALCKCECEDGEEYDEENGCIGETDKTEGGCTGDVPNWDDIASETMKQHCMEVNGDKYVACEQNDDGKTWSYKARCAGNRTGGKGGSGSGDDPEFQIPEDLKQLRWQLAALLQSKTGSTRNQPYGGQLTVDMPQEYADALASIDQAIATLSSGLDVPRESLTDLASFDATDDIRESLAPLAGPLERALSGVQDDTARRNLSDIARTGGMVETDAALAGIREAAMFELERMQAEEREKFGNLGLAAGSDISHALSQGAAEGLAKMARDQYLFQTDVDKLQAQNRTAASTALGNLDISELSQLINAVQTASQVYTAPTRAGMQSAGIRHAASSSLAQLAQMQSAPWMQRAAMQQSTGDKRTALDTQNINALYQEWQRQQQPSPYLNAALSFATGFPPQAPQKPIIQGGGGGTNWGSLISTIAMLGMAPMSGGGSLLGTGLGSLFNLPMPGISSGGGTG